MSWAHLPVAGGIYDQDPVLLDRWRYVMGRQAEYDQDKREKEEMQRRGRTPQSRIKSGRGRR